MKYIITLFSLLFTINLSHSQSAPVASNVSAATVKNTNASIHLVASDADFDSLTYSIVSNPSNGTISLSDDIVTYTPTTDYTGKDTFTFKANDGSLDSAIKTVTVKVIGGYKTTQTQIGTDIDGEAADDYSGASVSFNEDGTKVAIGAYGNDGNGINSGHVRVYSWNGSAWTKLGDDIDGEAAGDFSGNSVSLSSDGTTVAIGAYQNNGNGGNSGHVRVYSWSGSVWTKQGDDINGEASNDQSGYSVSLSSDGTTVAIGANKNDGNGNNAGHVRVYSWNGSAWTKLGNDIDGEALNDESGSRVSLSSDGTTVAIGAYYNDANGSDSGHVRVYSWNGSAWTKLGDDIDGEATNDYSGYSVSLSSDGTTVAIGTIYDDANGNNSGQVRVYSWSGSTWTKLGDDINGESGGDYVGYSVSLSSDGTILAIAAYSEEGNGLNVGHVKVYSWNGSTWTKLGDDIDGESAGDFFGRSVSLSSDGTTVAIGSTQHGGSSGHVRVYNLVNANAPVAVTDTMTVVEDASLTSKDVIANDTDVEGDTLSLTSVTTAGTGTVAINADGVSVDYTPAANFNGTEVITYTVSDGTLTNATGTLTVTVTAVNDAPVAVANTLTVLEDAALTSTDVIANDTDIDGDTLSLTSVTTAGTGTVAINTDGVSVDYTPAANFNGTEVITYTVSDGTLTDATGTLTVTVTAVNDAPVAVTDTMTVVEDASLTSKDVIANDTDVEGDTLSLTSVTTAGTGTVAINADGVSVDYTPAANFNGTEVITYTVSDGTLTNATGTLTVTVTAVNDAPVAVANTLTVLEDAALTSTDVIANDTDIDGDTLSLTSVTTAGTGTVAINTDGVSVDYTPAANFNGTEVITYTVSDGTLTDATGTLTVTVTAVNDAPVAVTDTMTVVEDASLTSKDVIANDTDVEGDTLSLTSVTTAGTGTVAINADGVSVDYTPAANFNGTEVITYTVSDGTLTNATGTLTVTVTAVNDAPVAVANTLTVLEDAALTSTDVIANDTDIDGDTLSLTSVTTAGTGTVAINTDGVSVDYTPAANFNGTEVITYTVSDGTLTDATGTLTVTVTAVNDAPVAISISSSEVDDGDTTNNNSLSLTFTTSQSTSNFTESDITVSGGTLSDFKTVSSTIYTAIFTPSSDGATTIDVAANTFTDSSGNDNSAATQFNWTYDSSADSTPTDISGTISSDTVWHISNSPYNIVGSVLVNNNVTLTIKPGVIINFSDDFKILVKGNIISSGTNGSLITFNGNSSEGSNQMIIFKSTNLSNSTITYNVFNGPQKAIQLADESEGNEDSTKNSGILTVTYSDFNNAGLYTKGYSTSAELKFENSTFDDLIIKGYYPRSEPITFTNCVINNSSIDSDAYNLGISIISSTIKNSNITMGCCSANFLFNGSIVYNSNISNGMGSPVNGLFKVVNSFFVSSSINLPSSHFVSEKSIFFSKNSASDMLSIGNTEISNSSFIGYDKTLSSTGIKISGRAGYNIGGNTNISYSTLLNFNSGLVFDGKNTIGIANNNILSNSLYNVKNNTSSDLILENNYWGTSTEAEIQNLLYDSNEDVDKGTIDYTPFSTALNTTAPISLPSNVTKSVSGSDVVLNWSANGESDVAGYKLYYGTPTGYSYVTTVDLGNVTTYTVTGGDIATEYAITAYDSDKDDDDDMVDGNESWFSVSNQVNVTLSSSATSISEPTNSATLTATLDNTSSADVVVNLTYTGTATNATDYSGAASITISAGSLTGTTAITAIDDTDDEPLETIVIDIASVSNASESSSQQVSIDLQDNEGPSIVLSSDVTTISENGEESVITATLTNTKSFEVTVPFTTSGTATLDSDYSIIHGNQVTTVAGGNGRGSESNQIFWPSGVFIDSSNNIYVADHNHRVVKWEPGATEGVVIAGNGSSGSGLNQLNTPYGIYVDSSENLYVADYKNHRIMKWPKDASEGIIVAGGNGEGSGLNQLNNPHDVELDSSGNIYIADRANHRVVKWAPDESEGVLVAGTGLSGSENNELYVPYGIDLDSSGNIYVADYGNSRIMKWGSTYEDGGTLVAGGNGTGEGLNKVMTPYDIHVDGSNNIFITEPNNHRITKWVSGSSEGILIAGGNGEGSGLNQLDSPTDISADSKGNIFISDFDNDRVQRIQIANEITISSGSASSAVTFKGIDDSVYESPETIIVSPSTPVSGTLSSSDPISISVTSDDTMPSVSFALSSESIDENSSSDVTLTATLSAASETITTIEYSLSGTAESSEYTITDSPITIAAGQTTGTATISTNGKDDTDVEIIETIIITFGEVTNATRDTNSLTLNLLSDDKPSVSFSYEPLTFLEDESSIITATVSEEHSKNITVNLPFTGTANYGTDYSVISKVYTTNSNYITLNGKGTDLDQYETAINGMFVDKNNNVYLSDYGNQRILKWVPGAIEGIVVAGGNGSGSASNQISLPTGLYVDSDLNLFVLDEGNYRITKWAPGAIEGVVVVQASNGSGNSNLSSPQGFTMDKNGVFYIADTVNNRILRWESGASEGTVVAGGNGKGSALNQIYFPNDSHIDDNGDIYIADAYNGRIVKWVPGASEGIVVGTGLGSQNFAKYGDLIYAAGNDQILKWELGNTEGTVISGTGTGSGDNQYDGIWWIRKNNSGDIFIMDNGNERVQKVSNVNQIEILAGSKTGTFTITGTEDELHDESDETIIVSPSDPVNATLVSSESTTLTITNKNTAPVATAQADFTATEQTEVTITLVGTDLENDTLTYIVSTLPTNGTLSDNGTVITADDLPKTTTSADVVYVSTSDTATSDSFTFKVNDGTFDSAAATVSLDITAVNDAPIASLQSVTAIEQTEKTITLTGTDPEGSDDGPLMMVIDSLPKQGILKYKIDGTVITNENLSNFYTNHEFIYISTSDTASLDSFYFKTQNNLVSEPAIVTINITAVNDVPVATAQTDVAATEQTEVTISLAGTDAESDAITYIVSTLPTNGTLSDNGTVITADDLPKTTTTADVVYVSTSDTATSDSFTFKVNDGTVDSEAATISLAITAVNDEPTKVNLSSLVIDENAAATEIGTLSTDDLDTNDTFTYELVSGEGDTDNSLFTIETDKLKNIDAFDFETKSSYSVRIKSTDSGSASVEGVFAITVNNINDISISSEISSTYCDGSDGTGVITIVISETNGEVTYSWTGPNGFSSTDQNLTGLESGTYELTVKDDSFEKSIELVVEKTEIFNELSVCYVTTDSDDFTKNRIFLSYKDIYNDKKYEILREGSEAGVYEKIGEIDSGESSFLDTSSNNSSSSYSYKVRLVDNCDLVSPESSGHRTILLQSSLAVDNSVNLSWTSYEGVSYSTYKIYRRVNNGDFEELTSISSANNSYNDTEADVTQNAYAYYVSIAVESCTTTQKTGAKENLSNNFRYTSRANETTEIKSNQKFIQDDNADYDNDGVLNLEDQCPNTPEDFTVDVNGCEVFDLPLNNNKVSVISASCIGNTDGSIGLSVEDASYAYSVTVTGKDDPITLGGETKTASVTGLGTGTYTVCFKVDGEDAYEQCFEVNIGEPKALSAFIDVDNDNKTTSIQLSGSSSYNVEVNGQRYDVKGDRFTTNLPSGLSIIKISTDLDCQGIIEKEVFISEDIHYYPNPTQTDVNVHVSGEDTMVQVSVFSEKGDLIYTREQQIQDFSRKTNIDLSRQITGTYIVVMDGPTVRKTFKIVKR